MLKWANKTDDLWWFTYQQLWFSIATLNNQRLQYLVMSSYIIMISILNPKNLACNWYLVVSFTSRERHPEVGTYVRFVDQCGKDTSLLAYNFGTTKLVRNPFVDVTFLHWTFGTFWLFHIISQLSQWRIGDQASAWHFGMIVETQKTLKTLPGAAKIL